MSQSTDNFILVLRALDEGAHQLEQLIAAGIRASDTVHARLPAEQQSVIGARLATALRESIDLAAPTPLTDLLDEGALDVTGCGFSDTQRLLALARQAAMDLLRPQLRHDPDVTIALVDKLGNLLGAAREHEVERAIALATRNTEQQSQELKATLHRLEQSFLTSPLATLEADSQGVITRWNPAAEQIFGWPAAEAIGRNAIELLVPGLAHEHVSAVVGALLSGEATNSRNVNVRKDGQLITCQWHNAVLRDEHGAVVGWLSQTQDVTEQIAASEQLAQSESYLKTIFGAMNDIVLVIDSAGVYRDVAPTQPELRHGHSRGLLGRRIADLIGPAKAEEFLSVIGQVLASGSARQHLYSFPGPDGEQYFNATVSKLGPDRVLWVARDISEQRRAEAELAALQEQIIAAQQAALRELSTPIIPLGDGVVAMPLIGSIDSARAQQVIETLLEGVGAQRASAAILDITGVPVVDTQVANALLRAAQAVKLLGARVIITGIRPEVAQTLVGLGLDLSGITTLATLQSGIQHALRSRR